VSRGCDEVRAHTLKTVVNGQKRQVTFAPGIIVCEISHRSFEHFLFLLFYREETFPPASIRASGRFPSVNSIAAFVETLDGPTPFMAAKQFSARDEFHVPLADPMIFCMFSDRHCNMISICLKCNH
jgi:hypothetical protein